MHSVSEQWLHYVPMLGPLARLLSVHVDLADNGLISLSRSSVEMRNKKETIACIYTSTNSGDTCISTHSSMEIAGLLK